MLWAAIVIVTLTLFEGLLLNTPPPNSHTQPFRTDFQLIPAALTLHARHFCEETRSGVGPFCFRFYRTAFACVGGMLARTVAKCPMIAIGNEMTVCGAAAAIAALWQENQANPRLQAAVRANAW